MMCVREPAAITRICQDILVNDAYLPTMSATVVRTESDKGKGKRESINKAESHTPTSYFF